MGLKQVHIKVKGRVQGVFFRANTQREAERLGLTGWVKNTPDGAVEIKAEGEESQLKYLVEWCGHGPCGANVTTVDAAYGDAVGEFEAFNIKYL